MRWLDALLRRQVTPRLALAAAQAAAARQGLQVFDVAGANMAPALEPGHIVWHRPATAGALPARMGLVAVRLAVFGDVLVPSRVVALPAETMQLRGGQLLVQGAPVAQPFLDPRRPEHEAGHGSGPSIAGAGARWVAC